MTVDIQVKKHLLLFGRKNLTGASPFNKGFQTELSVNTVTQCTFNCTSNNKSCIILDHFLFIFKGLRERFVICYIGVIDNRPDKGFMNGQQIIS